MERNFNIKFTPDLAFLNKETEFTFEEIVNSISENFEYLQKTVEETKEFILLGGPASLNNRPAFNEERKIQESSKSKPAFFMQTNKDQRPGPEIFRREKPEIKETVEDAPVKKSFFDSPQIDWASQNQKKDDFKPKVFEEEKKAIPQPVKNVETATKAALRQRLLKKNNQGPPEEPLHLEKDSTGPVLEPLNRKVDRFKLPVPKSEIKSEDPSKIHEELNYEDDEDELANFTYMLKYAKFDANLMQGIPELKNMNLYHSNISESFTLFLNSYHGNNSVHSALNTNLISFIQNNSDLKYEDLVELEYDLFNKGNGYNLKTLNQLKPELYKGDKTEKCVICQMEFNKNDKVSKLKCGHLFHYDCIKDWLQRKKRCPFYCQVDSQFLI